MCDTKPWLNLKPTFLCAVVKFECVFIYLQIGRAEYSPPIPTSPYCHPPGNAEERQGEGWEEASYFSALEMNKHPTRTNLCQVCALLGHIWLTSPLLPLCGLAHTPRVTLKTISEELPVIILLPNPLAPFKFSFSFVSITLDYLPL